MREKQLPSERSLLLDYISPADFVSLFRAAKKADWPVFASISVSTLLKIAVSFLLPVSSLPLASHQHTRVWI